MVAPPPPQTAGIESLSIYTPVLDNNIFDSDIPLNVDLTIPVVIINSYTLQVDKYIYNFNNFIYSLKMRSGLIADYLMSSLCQLNDWCW